LEDFSKMVTFKPGHNRAAVIAQKKPLAPPPMTVKEPLSPARCPPEEELRPGRVLFNGLFISERNVPKPALVYRFFRTEDDQ
jgi:hypothetical protein